jgi:hypothetical protein
MVLRSDEAVLNSGMGPQFSSEIQRFPNLSPNNLLCNPRAAYLNRKLFLERNLEGILSLKGSLPNATFCGVFPWEESLSLTSSLKVGLTSLYRALV